MRITRVVHEKSAVVVGPAAEILPDLNYNAVDGNGEPVDMTALAFVDPDRETHVFLLDPDGRRKIAQALTRGVILPGGAPLPPPLPPQDRESRG